MIAIKVSNTRMHVYGIVNLLFASTCYFTAEDGRYVKTFHAAINHTFDGGGGLWISQTLTDKMLNTYLMKMITSTFKEEERHQKNSLEAASCIGRQPKSKVWVLNSSIQIKEDGNLIPKEEQTYVWITDKLAALRGLDSGVQLSAFLANPELQHQIKLPLSTTPLYEALQLLRQMMGFNFIPSVFTLAAVPINIHFEYFQKKFNICPVIVLVGHPQSGKTTSLRVAAALTGSAPSDQFSEITDAYAAKRLSESIMGFVIDDSSSSKSMDRLTIRQFNNFAKGTLTHGKQLSRCGVTFAVNHEYLPNTKRLDNCFNMCIIHAFTISRIWLRLLVICTC